MEKVVRRGWRKEEIPICLLVAFNKGEWPNQEFLMTEYLLELDWTGFIFQGHPELALTLAVK